MKNYLQQLMDKYSEVIKEEVNVKHLHILQNITINKIYKPLGSSLSAKFGKDTGAIIKWGKEGNVKEAENGGIIVFDDANNERFLHDTDYTIEYSGIDENNTAIDRDILVQLDLSITPELYQEGVARELSRFLNQMRKDHNYNINDKLQLQYTTNSSLLEQVMQEHQSWLMDEALLISVKKVITPTGDIVQTFVNDDGSEIIFALCI